MSEITKEKIREHAQQFQSNLLKIVEDQFNEMIDVFDNEIKVAEKKQSTFAKNDNNIDSNNRKGGYAHSSADGNARCAARINYKDVTRIVRCLIIECSRICTIPYHIWPSNVSQITRRATCVSQNSEIFWLTLIFFALWNRDLFEVSHISTIHNIFVAVLLLFFLNGFLSDFLDTGGRIKWDFGMIFYAFGKLDQVIWVWLIMKMSTVLILYPAFEYWAWNRILRKKTMDTVWLTLYVLYLAAMFILPLRTIIIEDLPPASSNIILCEQVRLIMKVHAFVRENIPRALKYKPHQDADLSKKDESPCPEFSKFLYFLFVPTLIYRDTYPRTKKVRWRYVLVNFLQVFGCLVYVFFVFQRFCIPAFKKFGHEPMTARSFLLTIFSCMLPGFLVFLSAFFALLHCWMNAFAEMLRFGDRMFYRSFHKFSNLALKDQSRILGSKFIPRFCTCVHSARLAFERSGNLPIYQVSRTHIMGSKNRVGPLITVFLLSAIVHEYIVTFTFHFFFPILFVLFQGFGVWLIFITRKADSKLWNIFVWMSLIAGSGILLALYSMEWYSHINCPATGVSSILSIYTQLGMIEDEEIVSLW
ncbi:Sterol O-acyltransferase 1 [Nymphon striatum]|nr:Sterol O-acyltransferase 1 [Nymphon striatum]